MAKKDNGAAASRTVSIPLRTPLNLGGITCDALDLREPTAGDMERASNVVGGVAGDMELLCCITGTPLALIKKVGLSDHRKAMAFLRPLMTDIAPSEATEFACDIPLADPIVVGDTTYEILKLREPMLGELDTATKAPGSGVSKNLALIGCIVGLDPKKLRPIRASELNAAVAFLSPFMDASPETTES
jgi:hypothetical protein